MTRGWFTENMQRASVAPDFRNSTHELPAGISFIFVQGAQPGLLSASPIRVASDAGVQHADAFQDRIKKYL